MSGPKFGAGSCRAEHRRRMTVLGSFDNAGSGPPTACPPPEQQQRNQINRAAPSEHPRPDFRRRQLERLIGRAGVAGVLGNAGARLDADCSIVSVDLHTSR